MRYRTRAIAVAFLAFALLAVSGRAARGQAFSSYAVQKIGLVGSPLNYGEGINDSGIAVGGCDPSGLLRPYALRAAVFQNGQTSGAGVLYGFEGSYDYAINELGRSVGWAVALLGIQPGPQLTHAVLFAHGTAQDLGALPGPGNTSMAYAINNLDVAVGYSQTTTSSHAVQFAFFAGRAITDLGTLPGDSSSVAYGINDTGMIVGSSFDANVNEHAAQFAPGPVTALGTLPGDTISEARGINNQGQAVGFSTAFRGPSHAVMFAGGEVIDLGVYPGGTHSSAHAINNLGQVIGTGDTGDGGFDHALLWQNGGVTDLGKLPGGGGSSANGINDRGDIVGTADDGDGTVWAVKWTLAHLSIPPTKGSVRPGS